MKKILVMFFMSLFIIPVYAVTYDDWYKTISESLEKDPYLSCLDQVHNFLWPKIDFENEKDPNLQKLDQSPCACRMWAREHDEEFDIEEHHKELKVYLDRCIELSNTIEL